jgi:hypothetical protein
MSKTKLNMCGPRRYPAPTLTNNNNKQKWAKEEKIPTLEAPSADFSYWKIANIGDIIIDLFREKLHFSSG